MPYTRDDVAKLVDHTLLKSETTHSQVHELVEEANEFGVCSMCVSPSLLPLPLDLGNVKPTVVCKFPSEAHRSDAKATGAARTTAQDIDKVDMVVDPAQVVGDKLEKVEADIRTVHEAMPRAVLKAITEPAALSDEQIVAACGAAKVAGADSVKTSTRSHPSGGALVHAVALIKATVEGTIQVKAPGGIHDGRFAAELLDAEVTRLSLSASAKALNTLRGRLPLSGKLVLPSRAGLSEGAQHPPVPPVALIRG